MRDALRASLWTIGGAAIIGVVFTLTLYIAASVNAQLQMQWP